MKLKTTLLSLMLLAGIAAKADDMARVVLQHNGQATVFAGDKINDALNQAVDGDTVILSNGHFPGFTISKKIFVRGGGESTLIQGSVDINIFNEPVLTMPVLEGLKITQTLSISKNCTNLVVRFCVFSDFISTTESTPNALFDRCHCFGTFNISEHMTDFYVRNCDINYLNGSALTADKCNFINCLIYSAKPETTAGRFVNCQIQRWDPIRASMLVNTLVYTYRASVYGSTVTQDCYYDNTSGSWYSSTDLAAKGYKSIDGTIVGNWGGDTPFTGSYTPQIPHETLGTIAVDNESKKLNVEMEIEVR